MVGVRIRGSTDRVPVIGHRGASVRCPENTIPAFDAALELGAAWVETDVKMTADEHFVLMHDLTVDRTTDGTGAVEELRLDQLAVVRQACGQISTGILYPAEDDGFVEQAAIAGVDFLHPHRKTVTPELISKAHEAALPVVACVDPDIDLIRERIEWGLDVFNCDEPDLVTAAVERGSG